MIEIVIFTCMQVVLIKCSDDVDDQNCDIYMYTSHTLCENHSTSPQFCGGSTLICIYVYIYICIYIYIYIYIE